MESLEGLEKLEITEQESKSRTLVYHLYDALLKMAVNVLLGCKI